MSSEYMNTCAESSARKLARVKIANCANRPGNGFESTSSILRIKRLVISGHDSRQIVQANHHSSSCDCWCVGADKSSGVVGG